MLYSTNGFMVDGVLTTTTGNQTVTCNWSSYAASGATGYNLYRNGFLVNSALITPCDNERGRHRLRGVWRNGDRRGQRGSKH